MRFWNQTIDQDNNLTEALFEYKNALERGYYEALNQYKLDNRDWTDTEEINFIANLLRDNTEELESFGIELSNNLLQELRNGQPYGIHRIAHFISALDILKTQKQVLPEEELEQLNTSKINVQIEVGMPIACLAKLGAIKCSSLEKDTKISLISHLIDALLLNNDKFGVINDAVLKVVLDEWLTLADSASLSFKETVQADYQRVTALANKCHSIEDIKQHLTYFDRCILAFSEQLNNDIGKINIDNKESHLSTPSS